MRNIFTFFIVEIFSFDDISYHVSLHNVNDRYLLNSFHIKTADILLEPKVTNLVIFYPCFLLVKNCFDIIYIV